MEYVKQHELWPMNTVAVHGNPAEPLSRKLVLARWIGYLALLDLLLLPYFQLVILPLSLPLLVAAAALLNPKLKNDHYLVLFLIIACGVVASVAISIGTSETDEYLPENVKRVLQLFSTFVYFFYFRWLASRVPLRTGPILVFFMAWIAALALMFFVQPERTGEFLRVAYGRLATSEDVLSEHLRFAYLFTDPNTAAYFLLIAAAPLLMTRRSTISLILIVLVLTLLTFVTQSKGALIALFLMCMTTLYPPARFISSLLSVRKALALILLAIVLSALLVYVFESLGQSSDLVRMAYERVFEAPDEYATGGSRFEVWRGIASHFLPLPFGRGYALVVDGVFVRPHSDVLRLLYSYGLVALLAAGVFFFSRIRSFTPLIIPALMAFLINSLIDEQKLLALFLSLLAICIGSEERRKRG
jgi:hypothetical protein